MTPPLGVILAGGLATRMGGGDKGLLQIGGQSLLARVRDRLGPQGPGKWIEQQNVNKYTNKV